VSRLGPALAVRDFRAWWLAYGAMYLSVQMIDVAIGWQVYTEHHSTLDLGLIGLVEFIPMLLFSLPAGVLADRRPRRTIFAVSLLFGAGIGGVSACSAAYTTRRSCRTCRSRWLWG
jgi:MFS family permease